MFGSSAYYQMCKLFYKRECQEKYFSVELKPCESSPGIQPLVVGSRTVVRSFPSQRDCERLGHPTGGREKGPLMGSLFTPPFPSWPEALFRTARSGQGRSREARKNTPLGAA